MPDMASRSGSASSHWVLDTSAAAFTLEQLDQIAGRRETPGDPASGIGRSLHRLLNDECALRSRVAHSLLEVVDFEAHVIEAVLGFQDRVDGRVGGRGLDQLDQRTARTAVAEKQHIDPLRGIENEIRGGAESEQLPVLAFEERVLRCHADMVKSGVRDHTRSGPSPSLYVRWQWRWSLAAFRMTASTDGDR